PGARCSTTCPRRSRSRTAASPWACSGIRGPTSAAGSSRRWSRRRRRPGSPEARPPLRISSARRAPEPRHEGGGVGRRRRRGGRPRAAPAPAPAPARRRRRRLRGARRPVRRRPALAHARRLHCCAAHVGLPRALRDAPRRPGGARAPRARALPRADRPRPGLRRAARRAPAAGAVAARGDDAPGRGARLGALALVPGAARNHRLPAGLPSRPLPSRRDAHALRRRPARRRGADARCPAARAACGPVALARLARRGRDRGEGARVTSVPAATDDRRAPGAMGQDDEEMPRLGLTGRRALLFALFVASAIALLYFVLPRLAGLKETWHRLNQGDPWWLAIALLFEAVSFFGYVWL